MLCTLVVVLYFYGTCFRRLSTGVKKTQCFVSSMPDVALFLKRLKGNRNTLMNTLFVNFGALNF
jgi:hypothetical protein